MRDSIRQTFDIYMHMVLTKYLCSASLPPPPPKQDIQLRLKSLPPPPSLASYPVRIQEPFLIPQLSQILVLLSKCVEIVEMSMSTGDPHNGPFIAGQLGILADTIDDARHVLKGGEGVVGGRWWEDHLQATVSLYAPPMPKIGLYKGTKLILGWIFLSRPRTTPMLA